MNITFIGSGYVGLVSGIIMSYLGHNITCLDNNEVKISKLNKQILPIYELSLDEYLQKVLLAGRLKFTNIYSLSHAYKRHHTEKIRDMYRNSYNINFYLYII
jgi:UDPglucose 6-dehydrogenase